ncbi:MAG TPA: Hpt domain-containing protein, partial [Kofleriaceae bacterium]
MAGDPYKYFRVEAHEIVGDLAKALAELEAHADAALVTKLLRLAHTLKGAARIVRHKELAELSHQLETVLDPLRTNPTPRRDAAALTVLDRMTAAVTALDAPAPPAPAAVVASVVEQPAPAPPPARLASAAIDDALGGLTSAHALLSQLRASTDPNAIQRGLDQLERELGEVRRDVEHLRLSAVGASYTALERTARDAAQLTAKKVRFALEGADVRVDGSVLAALHGALVQLVRNAVVHGIETPAQRLAAKKPVEGRVAIVAQARGRTISIACEDDGRGLDLPAIRTAAAKQGQQLGFEATPTQAFQLLLRGGISTAREVTELSGRGIGLDLVRDAVDTLGGEIEVTTGPTGTRIALVVPVSVSALAAITVTTGDRTIAIPQAAVRRVQRVVPSDFVTSAEGTALVFEDVQVPAAALGRLFDGTRTHGTTALFVDGGDGIAAFTV